MQKIEVEIEGETPLLMHSCHNMMQEQVKKNPTKQYDPVIDAEKVAYRSKNGDLFIPARCIKASLINAAAWSKFGKKSAKPIVAGCTRIEPLEVSLGVKKYEIDLRPVVVVKQRIIRARPCLDKWKAKFQIIYNEKMIGNPNILREFLEDAGQRIGLLDNRPQTYGENGCFKVTKFLPIEE